MDSELNTYSDDVKRLAHSVNLHVFAGNTGQWAAYKLQDCTTNNDVYPDRKTAVRILFPYQDQYFYVWLAPSGISLEEAEIYLNYNRALYEQGWRMPDPGDLDADTIPTMPNTKEDAKRQLRLLTRK